MHSSLNRVQAVFGFFTTVALFVAGFAALSVLVFPADDATSAVELKNVQVYVPDMVPWCSWSKADLLINGTRSVKGRPHYYSKKKEEYAQMRFDLDADLSPLFNWNTKQLFVYVYASYSSSEDPSTSLNPYSEAIIWDTIIQAPESPYSVNNLRERFFPSAAGKRKSSSSSKLNKNKNKGAAAPGVLRLRGQKGKYQIGDITGKLAERSNVTLSVGWNVQPWVGALWWSPRSGAIPRTVGTAGTSKPFDFPALKGSKKPEGAAAEGQASKEKAAV